MGSYSEKNVENAAYDGLGGFSRERFMRGLGNLTDLLGTIGLANLPDMASLFASGRLQNAIKYCTKV